MGNEERVRRVGIVGASGYSGAVAARLLAHHPFFELVFCTSDKLAGRSVGRELGVTALDALTFSPNSAGLQLATAGGAGGASVSAVVLATSAEVSAKLAPKIIEAGRAVVDLSGAFRLESAAYPRWYGFEHPSPELLPTAHYGLPELFGPPPPGACLVANPGCYPTASLLALAPLLRERLVDPMGIIVDAKSGVTGAGRSAKEELSFGEVSGDLRAYKLLSHQHTPEIERFLSRFQPAKLTFTAHLLPIRRGLMATCYARPRPGVTEARVRECFMAAYANSPFVDVVPAHEATLARVAGTNQARVGAVADGDTVIVVSAIDNLVKGAAGQAIQNLNLMFHRPETEGLDGLQRFAA